MKRTILLMATMTIAVLAVGVAMLFGMGKPAQAQSNPEPPCDFIFCLDKTASSSIGSNTVEVGEPITFTITERCPGNPPGCSSEQPIVDTLPSGAGFTDVSVPAGCTLSGNTVTCTGRRESFPTQPFTLTIVATPTECGEFTNTANKPTGVTAKVTFAVLCDTRHPRVSSTVPTKGATGVGPNANAKANFSEDMRASTINGQTFKLFKQGSRSKVGATVSYNPNLDRAVLNPNNPLKSGTTYKAVVTTAARDEAGNRLDQKPWVSGLQPKVWFFTVSN
jgi:Bacterial Ig-like domain